MEHGVGPHWAFALQQSWLGSLVRDSLWIYPAANLVHLLGLVMLIGPIVALDLRLLGLGRHNITVPAASRFLTPFAIAGILLMLPSGTLLFAADAASLAGSRLMQVKIALVALALTNAVLFRLLWSRQLAGWDAAPPVMGQVQAAISVGLWLSVGYCGRMIAYL
ncbi:MAG: putative rane protein [Xanthobacteraceae bacterium]|jgi:hypothetical protein|nr:putative rane protein [Xanthobacteraceae bacterium]